MSRRRMLLMLLVALGVGDCRSAADGVTCSMHRLNQTACTNKAKVKVIGFVKNASTADECECNGKTTFICFVV